MFLTHKKYIIKVVQLMKSNNLLLILIVFFGFLIRVIGVGQNPPSLTWDEVAWGYNAYSIGTDGSDEFGKFLPIQYLESFGDFKPPLYAYLAIIPIKIFGLNEFATRFPSVLAGTLTVLVAYYLVKEIFGEDKEKLALLSSLILAISPWHIMLSRAAFEANIATFFISLGIFLFLRSLRTNPWLILPSILSFVLSTYTFNSARVVSPIIFVILCILFWKEIFKIRKEFVISSVVGFIVMFPLLIFLTQPQASLRFSEVNIFSDISIIDRTNLQIANDNNSPWSKLIHNRRFVYGMEYIRHYFDNLTPKFLFISGDGNPKFSIQDVGQLYIWEIPFIAAGLILLFRKKERYWWLIPIWLLVGIFPAGFARETPHGLRIENSLPTFQILTAYGVLGILSQIPKKYKNFSLRSILIGFFVCVASLNFIYFIHNYSTHYAREFSGEWQYAYKEAVKFVSENKSNYKKIFVTESLGRPYIYFLFYEKYSPARFREESVVTREALGFVHVKSFDNYEFIKTPSDEFEKSGGVLFLTTPGEVPQNASIVKEFRNLNDETSLVAFTL